MNMYFDRINVLAIAYASEPKRLLASSDYLTLKNEYARSEKGLIHTINSATIKNEKDILELIKQFAGGVSNPSKMPWYSWSTPAIFCKTGSKLAKIDGSICSECYAMDGNYRRPNVRAALLRRYMMYDMSPSVWFHAFDRFFSYYAKDEKTYFFRWFDSGDLVDLEQLGLICRLAINNNHIKFWLPTREASLIDKVSIKPDNLIIRYSSPMVDTLSKRINSSGVVSPANSHNLKVLRQICGGSFSDCSLCPATTTDDHTCKGNDCNACWEPGRILYQLH